MRTSRRDDGFTLVELLVAMTLTAMIVPVLTGALVIGWRTTDATIARIGDTRDRQLVPSLFTRDIMSSQTFATTGTACTQGGDTLVVRLTMAEPQDATTPPAARTVAWVLTSGLTLDRRWCPAGSTVASSVTAAHGIVGTPTVTCRVVAGGTSQACSTASSDVVDLSVVDASGTFTATGQRRS
jgi:prepilin-type N-terminal cleavage/methylation domain-containing protein